MDTLETRELRYFVTVAEELHFGRAAERLGIAQPPLSRAIQQLERRLGVALLDRNRRGVTLTGAGEVLLDEGRAALAAATAAANRTRRAASPDRRVVLAVKSGADHDLLQRLLAAHDAEIEVLLCGINEQTRLLRDGRADAALVHRPFDDYAGFDSEELLTEEQVAIVPATHRLATRASVTLAEVSDLPDLPMARWPRVDGTYPPGPGPEVHDQSQLAQLIALGKGLVVIPVSALPWLWSSHAAIPVSDAAPVTTLIIWPPHSRSRAVADLVRTATSLPVASASP